MNYILSADENRRQNLNVNLIVQGASDEQGGVVQGTSNQFYMGNAAYSVTLLPRNLTITGAFNYNKNKALAMVSTTLGPTLTVSKSMLDKKMRVGLSSSWNESYANRDKINRITNLRANGSYSIKKKHNLRINFVLVNRKSKSEGAVQALTEFTGTVGYSYNFSTHADHD